LSLNPSLTRGQISMTGSIFTASVLVMSVKCGGSTP